MEQTRFDCVFCDYHMPGISGIETVRRLRERERSNAGGWRQPVFLLTANTNDKDMVESSRGLVNGVVDKQTQVAELLRLARSAMTASVMVMGGD